MAQPKNKVQSVKLDQLTPDDLNANQHTEYGMRLLEKSVSELGLGRSILIDKNNRIIAGNGVVETASQLGLMDVVVVETNGKQLVAVKRTDIDLDSTEGRELALADNATSKANIEWDQENLQRIQEEWKVDIGGWGVDISEGGSEGAGGDAFNDQGIEDKSQYGVIVMCDGAKSQEEVFNKLTDQGYKCKIVVT